MPRRAVVMAFALALVGTMTVAGCAEPQETAEPGEGPGTQDPDRPTDETVPDWEPPAEPDPQGPGVV